MQEKTEVNEEKLINDSKELIYLIKKLKKYWSSKRCDSYACFLNLIQGGRGIGKTTTLVDNKIKRYGKTKEQFIYLRRWKDEAKKNKNLPSKYIANKYRVEGLGGGSYKWIVNKDVLGYCITLSTSHQLKSVDFDRVTSIIFDEAIIKRSATARYIDNELLVLLEFISTVFRARENCRVYILGNNNDVFNPYYEYFNIPAFDEFYVDKERGIYCELAKNSVELFEQEQRTGLYKLTKDTAYGEYHYNNSLLIADNTKIIEKPKNIRFCYSFICNSTTIHVYNNLKEEYLYCEYINDIKKSETIFKIIIDGKINYALCRQLKGTQLMKRLVWEFFNDNIYYNSPQAVAIVEDIVNALK